MQEIYISGGNEMLENARSKRIIGVSVSLMIFAVLLLTHVLTSVRTPVTNFSGTIYVTNQTPPNIYSNNIITRGGMYDLFFSFNDKSHTVRGFARVEHEDGEVIWQTESGYVFFTNKPTYLRAGLYNIIVSFESQSEQPIPAEFSFAIR